MPSNGASPLVLAHTAPPPASPVNVEARAGDGGSGSGFPRLSTAIERNAALTRDLQAILQDTLKLTQSGGGGGPAPLLTGFAPPKAVSFRPIRGSEQDAEPDFHTRLDMGKVRVTVRVEDSPVAKRVVVDHRQTVGELAAIISARLLKDDPQSYKVAALFVGGAELDADDVVGDQLVDGDAVEVLLEGGDTHMHGPSLALPATPRAARGAQGLRGKQQAGGGGAEGKKATMAAQDESESEEFNMHQLMLDISAKINKADKVMSAKKEEERQSKLEAEALLLIFQSITKEKEDPTVAISSIITATLKMLSAEAVNLYLVSEDPQQGNKVNLVQSGLSHHVNDDLHDKSDLYEDMQPCLVDQGIVGGAATEHSRVTLLERDSYGNYSFTNASEQMKLKARGRSMVDLMGMDRSTTFDGADAPEGFDVKNMLVFGVSHVPECKSMVTFKTKDELKTTFELIDKDGGGTLDRDEIDEGMRSLGKRLTAKELDEAMAEMDDDNSGEVDLDEFSEWWNKSWEDCKNGNVVAVIQVFNKIATKGGTFSKNKGFSDRDVKSLTTVCSKIGYILSEEADSYTYQAAAENNEFLTQFQDANAKGPGLRKRSSTFKGASLHALGAERIRRSSITGQSPQGTSSKMVMDMKIKLPALKELQQWKFAALDYSAEQLVGCVILIFEDMDFLSSFKVTDTVLFEFVTQLFKAYKDVPFHNIYHGFSVFQGCYWLIKKKDSGMRTCLSRNNLFALLVAALGHDTGHNGTNNNFHVGCYDDLACTYNDISPLESMHASRLFETAKKPGCNIFGGLDRDGFIDVRKTMIEAIMGTDMQRYHQQKLRKLDELPKHDFEDLIDAEGNKKDKNFWISLLLHVVDIANVAYDWEQCYRWARMVQTEFQMQYAKEKESGLTPTAFLNCPDNLYVSGAVPNLAKSQVGFGFFVCKPTFTKIAAHIPVFGEFVENIEFNGAKWKELQEVGEDGSAVTVLPLPKGNEKKCMETVRKLLDDSRKHATTAA